MAHPAKLFNKEFLAYFLANRNGKSIPYFIQRLAEKYRSPLEEVIVELALYIGNSISQVTFIEG